MPGLVFLLDDPQKQALGYIIAQLLVTVVVSALLVFYGGTAAYSALIGGLIASLANAWFVPDITRLENELSEQLGASVNIRQSSPGKGRLEIHYSSLDELEGILSKIK